MRLSEKLEACAEEVASFPHPSACDHLHDASSLLREAAALARRVEEAPTGEVWQHACIGGQRTSSIIITREPEDGLAVIGKRVRIVEE